MPKNKNPNDPPKKRGQPSDFKGSRLQFLTENVPKYIEASKKLNGTGKTGKKKNGTCEFYDKFFFEYWRKFPWRIPIEQEPPPEPEEPPKDAEDAFKALDLDLTEEEAAKKSRVQRETKEKIKRWFGRQRPGAMGMHGNPYFRHLAQLRRHEQEPPPKRRPDYQFYMRHADFKDAVAARFEDEHGDAPLSKQLSLRCQVARDMLAEEPEEVKARLKKENEEAHTPEMEEYENSEQGLPSVDPEVQAECRENFMTIVGPLLAGLRAYTGYTLNLMAGRIDGTNYEGRSANAGVVKGKDWAQWDSVGYGSAVHTYVKFVHAVHLDSGVNEESSSSSPSMPMGTTPSAPIVAPAAPPAGEPAVPGLFWGMGTTMLRMSEPPQASDVDMPGPNPNEEGPVANHAPEVLMGPPATAAR